MEVPSWIKLIPDVDENIYKMMLEQSIEELRKHALYYLRALEKRTGESWDRVREKILKIKDKKELVNAILTMRYYLLTFFRKRKHNSYKA